MILSITDICSVEAEESDHNLWSLTFSKKIGSCISVVKQLWLLSSICELHIYNGRVLLEFAVTFLKGELNKFRAEFPRSNAPCDFTVEVNTQSFHMHSMQCYTCRLLTNSSLTHTGLLKAGLKCSKTSSGRIWSNGEGKKQHCAASGEMSPFGPFKQYENATESSLAGSSSQHCLISQL